MRRRLINFLYPLFFLLLAGPAQAIVIEFELEHLGANHYIYHYDLINDGSLGGASVSGFQIDFDPLLYDETSLTISSDAAVSGAWDELILGSIPAVVPAQYDACASLSPGACDGPGVAAGTSLGGFAVSFDWLGGVGGPGAQAFYIYDTITFALLADGVTQLKASPHPMPLPGALALLFSAVIGLALRRQI